MARKTKSTSLYDACQGIDGSGMCGGILCCCIPAARNFRNPGSLAAAAAAYFVFRNSEVEFEYLYVSNQLTIDRIYGKTKRKKAWEGSMDEIQIVAPTGSTEAKDHETNNMKVLDFSSHTPDAKTFTLISQSGSESMKIIFEPNDKLLHCMKMTAPRKIVDRV